MRYGKTYLQRAALLFRLGVQPADNGLFEHLLNASEEEFEKWAEAHGVKVVRHTDKAESQGPKMTNAMLMEYDKTDMLTKNGIVVKIMPREDCKVTRGIINEDR